MHIYSRIMVIRLTWIITFAIIMSSCSSVALSPAKNSPVPASKTEKKLLQQGGKYFTQGKFKPALQKAQAALKLNPDNVEAMYAIAISYLALDEPNKSLEFSQRATTYKTKQLAEIYLLMGSTYERLGDPWNALRTYRFATGQYSKNPEIQYRLGQTYAHLKKPEFASKHFKEAIRLEPNNAASHFELGALYYTHNYNTPALLSLSMALLLEPKREPASLIREHINKLLAREVIEIKKTDEGGFQSVDKALAIQRTALLQKSGKQTEIEILKAQYHTLFNTLDMPAFKNQTKTFVMKTYVPFYNKVYRQGLGDAFVYYIFQGNQDKTISNWLNKHPGEIKQLERLVAEK